MYLRHNLASVFRHWRRRAWAVDLLLVVVLCCAFDFSKVQRVTLEDFRSRGTHEDGKLSWELHGGKAEVRGPRVDLKGVDLLFHLKDGEKVRLTSPACTFSQATEMGESDEPIHIVGESFTLDGVGYDVLAGTQSVRIRSKVRMTVRGKGGKFSGTDPFAGFERLKDVSEKRKPTEKN